MELRDDVEKEYSVREEMELGRQTAPQMMIGMKTASH